MLKANGKAILKTFPQALCIHFEVNCGSIVKAFLAACAQAMLMANSKPLFSKATLHDI